MFQGTGVLLLQLNNPSCLQFYYEECNLQTEWSKTSEGLFYFSPIFLVDYPKDGICISTSYPIDKADHSEVSVRLL
jgi:hypothetical protein